MDESPPPKVASLIRYSTTRNKSNGRKKGQKLKGVRISEEFPGSNYSTDEQEWLRAITCFQHEHRRYLTLEEAFRLALGLGYRKKD